MSPLPPSNPPRAEEPALRVEAYRSLTELSPLAAALDELNRISRRPSPFDSLAFLEALLTHDEYARAGQSMLFLIAFDGATPVGWLALRKVSERLLGWPYRSIQCLVTHDTDRPRILARPEDEARCADAFYRYLFETERGWSALLLQEQDEASALNHPPAQLLRGHYLRRFPNNPNGTIELPFHSFDEYFDTFGRLHRKNLSRSVRKLAAAGELDFIASRDPAALPGLFELYLDLERRSWKSRIQGHVGRDLQRVGLFRTLLEPGQPLEMEISLLRLDGVPIAGSLCGAFGGGLYALEIAFDEGYRRHSPGNALLVLLIRDAIARGHRFINLLGNYAHFKARWHATLTETHAVQIYRRGSLVHLKALAGELLRWLRPPVMQRELSYNPARREAQDAVEPERPEASVPERGGARSLAEQVLHRLEEAGAQVARLRGDALGQQLPFPLPGERASARGAGAH